jgi:hypothetical protein
MTVASRVRRLLLGLMSALFLQISGAHAGQAGHDAKPTVAPGKPNVSPPRMTQADVTKPAKPPAGSAKAPEHGKPDEHAKPAATAKAAAPAKPAEASKAAKAAEPAPGEHANAEETTRAGEHVVTAGRSRRRSAERAVAALGAALSARRERVAKEAAAAPPPPPAPVRRPVARRRVAPAAPPAPPTPRYEVPWPSRIVEVRWPRPSEHRAVSWPSERPEPIELRWDLKALQSDLSEPTAAVER